MKHRYRQISIIAIAVLVAALIPATLLIAPRALADEAAASGSPQAHASVVRVAKLKAPKKKVVHRKFRPWSKPSPAQVREIIRSEARRWHIPAWALLNRAACESHLHWWASNGQFQGVLQFGPNAFYRGLRTIRSYKFQIVRSTTRRVHDARVTYFSDGTKQRRRTTPRRQRLIVVYTGRISRHPSMVNAFAQIRIGAQAIRGISAVHSSEWSCGI